MLVSGVQQSDSVTHIHVSILFQIIFPFWFLQNIEQYCVLSTFLKFHLTTLIMTMYMDILFLFLFRHVSNYIHFSALLIVLQL